MLSSRAATLFAAAFWQSIGVRADGIGMIGFGKDMYTPACAASCRNIIKSCTLSCTPLDSTENHGTSHNPVVTPPECFVKDKAFLKTIAVCVDNYCPLSDKPSMDILDDWWASHLATTTVGEYTWVPVLSYSEALKAGRKDEEKAASAMGNMTEEMNDHSSHGHNHRRHDMAVDMDDVPPGTPNVTSPLPPIAKGDPLNVTSFIIPRDWKLQHNGFLDFEENEIGHAKYTIVVCIVAIFLPVVISLLRFIPGLRTSPLWGTLQDRIVYPALWGKRHRAQSSFARSDVQVSVPTRGQTLYIALISFLNVIFLLAPYVHRQPQTNFPSLEQQTTSLIGNRAGAMAMGNAVALMVFASRNSPLFLLTDWSQSTYLILHRWLGYWAVFHTALHSVMLWAYYEKYGDYKAEFAREYWTWGIVATVACVAIIPFSLSVVRRKVYDFFLVTHVVFALLFITGYYYHIWFCFEHRWGYEIWTYIFGAIWGVERLVRLLYLIRGSRMATVTMVEGSGDEYLRIDIEGKQMHKGVVYLGFPTLDWRFWEFHPFSVAFASRSDEERQVTAVAQTDSPTVSEPEKSATEPQEKATNDSSAGSARAALSGKAFTTIFARTRDGMTRRLAARAKRTTSARLRVLVEGPYDHSGSSAQLKRCTRIICIAGGVGITAIVSYMTPTIGSNAVKKLYWSTRNDSLGKEFEHVLDPADVETRVGERLDITGILSKEFHAAHAKETGPIGIVVCGPGGMADDVRHAALELRKLPEYATAVPFVFVDESFSF